MSTYATSTRYAIRRRGARGRVLATTAQQVRVRQALASVGLTLADGSREYTARGQGKPHDTVFAPSRGQLSAELALWVEARTGYRALWLLHGTGVPVLAGDDVAAEAARLDGLAWAVAILTSAFEAALAATTPDAASDLDAPTVLEEAVETATGGEAPPKPEQDKKRRRSG